ncbi:MAG: hydrogenase maturation protease [Allorhizobium sp.]
MLLIGYGNLGRGDDGLGPAFTDRIEQRNLPLLAIDTDYQLTVDHALAVASAGQVIFADALIGDSRPFTFTRIAAGTDADLSSHSLTPAGVLSLAATLFGGKPEAHVLGISGYDFGEVKEGLSAEALRNLALAEAFFVDWYASADVDDGATEQMVDA